MGVEGDLAHPKFEDVVKRIERNNILLQSEMSLGFEIRMDKQ